MDGLEAAAEALDFDTFVGLLLDAEVEVALDTRGKTAKDKAKQKPQRDRVVII